MARLTDLKKAPYIGVANNPYAGLDKEDIQEQPFVNGSEPRENPRRDINRGRMGKDQYPAIEDEN